ncbi:unnamed protein product [Musa textilis]
MHLCFLSLCIYVCLPYVGLWSYLIKNHQSNTMSLIFQAKLVKLDVIDDQFPSTTLREYISDYKRLIMNLNNPILFIEYTFLMMSIGLQLCIYEIAPLRYHYANLEVDFLLSWHLVKSESEYPMIFK